MVKIPDSYGIIAKPSTQTEIAPPDNIEQVKGQIVGQLGQNLMNVATQLQFKALKEQETFNAAQVIDFKTNLARFENEKRVALNEMPATDGKMIAKTKDQFLKDRKTYVDNYLNNFKDDKNLTSLLTRQANSEAVDFEFDVDRVITSKKREYGQNAIYKSIYDINNRLEKGGNFNKLASELQFTLNTGFQAGLIDQQDIIRETEKQKAIVEELNKKYEKTRVANLIANGQVFINPNDSEDKKLGDLAYQTTIQNSEKQGIDPTLSTANFIQKTGYVPSQVKSIWSSYLNIGSPQQKLETAINITEVIKSNPNLQNQFNDDDVRFSMAISSRANAGLPATQVIDYANKEVSKYQSLDRQAKLQIVSNKNFTKKLDNEYKDLLDEYDPFFKSAPVVNESIKTTFNNLVKDQLLNTNATEESAIEFAKMQIKNEFSTTNVGKRQVMRYAPEVFYRNYNNGDTSWINKQFKSKIVENTKIESVKDIPDTYSLVPVIQTLKTAKPSYYIVEQKNKYGLEGFLLDQNNQKVIFTPEVEQAEFYKQNAKNYEQKNKQKLDKKEIINKFR